MLWWCRPVHFVLSINKPGCELVKPLLFLCFLVVRINEFVPSRALLESFFAVVDGCFDLLHAREGDERLTLAQKIRAHLLSAKETAVHFL